MRAKARIDATSVIGRPERSGRAAPRHAVAYKIATGLVAQMLPPVMLHALRQAVAGYGHSNAVHLATRDA